MERTCEVHEHKSKWKRSWWQHNTQAYTIFMATALPLESIGTGAAVTSGVPNDVWGVRTCDEGGGYECACSAGQEQCMSL